MEILKFVEDEKGSSGWKVDFLKSIEGNLIINTKKRTQTQKAKADTDGQIRVDVAHSSTLSDRMII